MLLLALMAGRARPSHPKMADLVLQGDISGAIQLGRACLAKTTPQSDALATAHVGQLLGRCLLATGREEDAEEIFRQQTRAYQDVSRAHVRWLSGLDQGAMQLHLQRPVRAAEALCAVADDPNAPAGLRVEAMVGAAVALHRAGECRSAWQSLNATRRLCATAADIDASTVWLVECVALELSAQQSERNRVSLDDHVMCSSYRNSVGDMPAAEQVQQQLQDAARRFADEAPMVAHRMSHLASLTSKHETGTAASAHLLEGLAWARARQLSGFEAPLRIEAALMMIARGAMSAAAELLAAFVGNETQARCSRHALDLHYCLSKLHQVQGRTTDALRWYRSHTQEAVLALRGLVGRRMMDSFMTQPHTDAASPEDATRTRLPLRYRQAYQYIIDNLHDENLSVRQVSSRLGVTERALQMAFRAHLGLTPAELIRNRRMERFREDLCADAGKQDLIDLASRWGIKSRSALASGYRGRFAETPMQTLQGGARAGLPAAL